MPAIRNQVLVHGDPRAVFDWVTTAKYWTQWHPATISVNGQIDKPLKIGDVVHERAKIGTQEGENDWTVVECDAPKHLMLYMPGTRLGDLRITYDFKQTDKGIEFIRTLSYDASSFPTDARALIEEQLASDSKLAVERIAAMVADQIQGGKQ
jgi:hypothetical protein